MRDDIARLADKFKVKVTLEPPPPLRLVPTGLAALDTFLEGGFLEGRINVIDFDTKEVQLYREGFVEQILAMNECAEELHTKRVGMGRDGFDPLREAIKAKTRHTLLVVDPYVGKLAVDPDLDAALAWVKGQTWLIPQLANVIAKPLVQGRPGARATVVLIASSLPKCAKFFAALRVAAEMRDGQLIFRIRKDTGHANQGKILPRAEGEREERELVDERELDDLAEQASGVEEGT